MKNTILNTYKILVIAPDWPPAHCGVAEFSKRLFEALLSKSMIVEHFVLRKTSDLNNYEKKIAKAQPDIVHFIFHSDHLIDDSYYYAASYTANTYKKAKLIFSYIPAKKITKNLAKALSLARHIISHGTFDVKTSVPVTEIPCGPTVFTKKLIKFPKLSKTYTILYFGFINRKKGIDRILKAFKHIDNKLPFRLKIMASIHQDYLKAKKNTTIILSRNLQQMTKRLNDPRIKISIGFSDSAQLERLLVNSDLCLLPYLDGATYKRSSFFNALAYGLPIVTTANNETPSSFYNIPGINFSKPTPKNLASAIKKSYYTRTDRTKIIKFYKNNYSWDVLIDKILKIYKK